MIAHQLSTVKNADLTDTVEEGKIEEVEKHGELVKENEKHTELYRIQSS